MGVLITVVLGGNFWFCVSCIILEYLSFSFSGGVWKDVIFEFVSCSLGKHTYYCIAYLALTLSQVTGI